MDIFDRYLASDESPVPLAIISNRFDDPIEQSISLKLSESTIRRSIDGSIH
jgi:hypothetical protein